jgi:hypothetical protein
MRSYKMYIPQNLLNGTLGSIWCNTQNISIPNDSGNRHYQEVLDAIIEQGAECFDGDVPQELLDAAEVKRLSNV